MSANNTEDGTDIVKIQFLIKMRSQEIIYSTICACSAASVTIINGLKIVEPKDKCPLWLKMSNEKPHFPSYSSLVNV